MTVDLTKEVVDVVNDPLCIPVDPHDYEFAEEPDPDDEFVSLADAGPNNDPAHVRPEDRSLARPGD